MFNEEQIKRNFLFTLYSFGVIEPEYYISYMNSWASRVRKNTGPRKA